MKPKTRSRVPKRKRRSANDILSRIVQAAGEEFKRSGYAGTTTAAIARRADVTEAQLFRYFESKSTLFRETVFEPIDRHLLTFVNAHMRLDEGKSASRQKMTRLYTSELQRFIRDNSQMLTSLVVAQTYQMGTAHGVGKIDSLATYFEHGASMMSKRLKKKPKIDPKLLVRLAFVAVLAPIMFKDWIFPPGLASDEDIEAAINDFILAGIRSN
jgi:AcrR family transcriptional regulator